VIKGGSKSCFHEKLYKTACVKSYTIYMINVGSSKIDFIAYTNCVYQMPIQGLTLVKQNSIRFIVVHVLYVPEDIFLCDDPKETTIVCDKSLT